MATRAKLLKTHLAKLASDSDVALRSADRVSFRRLCDCESSTWHWRTGTIVRDVRPQCLNDDVQRNGTKCGFQMNPRLYPVTLFGNVIRRRNQEG